MHRDLKPENLLVNERKEVKISDLGGAIIIDPMGNEFDHHVTTLYYEALEMVVETFYDDKVDMWAMGLILVEMYTMYPLCTGETSVEQLYLIREVLGDPDCDSSIGGLVNAAPRNMPALEEERKGGVGFQAIVPDASDAAIDLMSKLCCWEPYKRLTAAEALRHPFFTAADNAAAPPGFTRCVVPKATNLSYMQPIC